MDKVCYNLNEEELEEIENLYEKKVALENLSRCIDPDNEKMYQKLVNDYTSTIKKFNNWWKKCRIHIIGKELTGKLTLLQETSISLEIRGQYDRRNKSGAVLEIA